MDLSLEIPAMIARPPKKMIISFFVCGPGENPDLFYLNFKFISYRKTQTC